MQGYLDNFGDEAERAADVRAYLNGPSKNSADQAKFALTIPFKSFHIRQLVLNEYPDYPEYNKLVQSWRFRHRITLTVAVIGVTLFVSLIIYLTIKQQGL